MTWIECTKCQRHWRIHTTHPELFKAISRLCWYCRADLPTMTDKELAAC